MNAVDQHAERKRRLSAVKKGGYVSTSDLDDLHPQLIYGALLVFLRALGRSFLIIAPAFISWRVAAVVTIAAALLYSLVPLSGLAKLGLGLVLAESVFSIWLRRVRRRLQATRSLSERLPAPAGGLAVFSRTLEVVEACASGGAPEKFQRSPAEWLEGWFLGTPLEQIQQGNVREFFAWAFYTKQTSELCGNEQQAILGMIEECERRFHWGLKDGYNPAVKPIRINFDKMDVWCHPLTYYAGVHCLTLGARQTMRLFGFTYHASPAGGISFYHKPATPAQGVLIVDSEPVPPVTKLPVVFLHGLGVGLPPYLMFIRRLAAVRECFVLELPEVSQACSETVLQPEVMAAAIGRMLLAHGHRKACFVAHSYGTFMLSGVVRQQRDLVAQVVLMDPVCFLLAQPDVAFNFLYRKPTNPFTYAVAHFVRWELFSGNVLMRNFYWYHNVLWTDDLPAECAVMLGGSDDIVNAKAVRCHLQHVQQRNMAAGCSSRLRVLWFEDFFHGEVLLSKPAQLQILGLM